MLGNLTASLILFAALQRDKFAAQHLQEIMLQPENSRGLSAVIRRGVHGRVRPGWLEGGSPISATQGRAQLSRHARSQISRSLYPPKRLAFSSRSLCERRLCANSGHSPVECYGIDA